MPTHGVWVKVCFAQPGVVVYPSPFSVHIFVFLCHCVSQDDQFAVPAEPASRKRSVSDASHLLVLVSYTCPFGNRLCATLLIIAFHSSGFRRPLYYPHLPLLCFSQPLRLLYPSPVQVSELSEAASTTPHNQNSVFLFYACVTGSVLLFAAWFAKRHTEAHA